MGVTGAAGDRARETVDHIARYCASSLPRQLSLLERLVNIDSGSGDEAGLRRMITAMEEQWRRLGFQGAIVETATGPQLTAERPSPHGEAPRVLLIGHVDTVFPAGTAQARPFSVEGGRAYGPGVADMKGGLVTMLGAVDALRRVGALDRLHVTVIHNCDEETGSHGSRPIVEEEARGCHAVLVFEPGRPDGSIVHQRKGQLQYVLKLKGRAAHAGVAPEQGASAVEALAHKVVALHRLTDYGEGVVVNVGRIEGGSLANVVADDGEAHIDVRIPTPSHGERIVAAIRRIVAESDVPGVTSEWRLVVDRPPFVPSPSSRALLEEFQGAARQLGRRLVATATGGGSDGNFTAALAVPTVDGLGPVGGGFHSENEYIEVNTLAERAALTAIALARLSGFIPRS